MPVDLISNLLVSGETRFFADEIDSQDISFDYETSLGHDDEVLSLEPLSCDLMPFQHGVANGSEFMDTGLQSDSDASNSTSGVIDTNWLNDFGADDFPKFNPSDFPNLQYQVEDIKVEPISPLPSTPYNVYSPVLENKTENVLDTPPISPPLNNSPPTSPNANTNTEFIKVITLGPNGNLQLPSGAKLVNLVGSNNGVQNAARGPTSNIQPKPIANAPVVIKVLPSAGNIPAAKPNAGQPLVLTPEEFATLTQQSLGKPTTELTIPKVPRQTNGTVAKPISVASPVNPPMLHDGADMKALKRQQRMIKNRESACLSRKKKKEYVLSLETTLSEINKENQKLKQENAMLREKVTMLEKERDSLKNASFTFSSSPKKTTALFAILLVVSVNVASLGTMFMNQPSLISSNSKTNFVPEPASVSRHRTGRSLLWNTDDNQLFEPENTNASLQMCPMLINRTESSRIDSELRGWFHAPKKSNLRSPEPLANPSEPSYLPPKGKAKHELAKVEEKRPEVVTGRAYRKYLLTRQPSQESGSRLISKNEIQIYESLPDRYLFAAFFEAIQRKDDTFYVVSFSGDHLLLPATEHNNTVRPRMSLLLPAMPLNETMQPPPRHVAMMQIDCEVTNTRLLHINEDTIPPYYSGNRTADRKAESAKRQWKKYKRNQKKDTFDAIYARESR